MTARTDTPHLGLWHTPSACSMHLQIAGAVPWKENVTLHWWSSLEGLHWNTWKESKGKETRIHRVEVQPLTRHHPISLRTYSTDKPDIQKRDSWETMGMPRWPHRLTIHYCSFIQNNSSHFFFSLSRLLACIMLRMNLFLDMISQIQYGLVQLHSDWFVTGQTRR